MRTLRTSLSLFVALALGVFAWTGCDDSGSNSAVNGRMTLNLTDAPLDGVAEVNVTFERITLVPNDAESDDDSDDDSDADDGDDDGDNGEAKPVTVYKPDTPETINLLALQNTQTNLATEVEIPEGEYGQMRLYLTNNNYLVMDDGSEQPLTTPSAQESGFKVQIPDFEIDDNADRIELTLDFDASASVVNTGSGKYILKPVVKPTDVSFTDGDLELAEIESAGSITNYNTSENSITVEEVTFDVTSETEFEDVSTLDGLSSYSYASVEAVEADDGSYDAVEIEALNDQETRYEYEGVVTAVEASSITLLGQTVAVTSETVFEDDGVSFSTFADAITAGQTRADVEFTKASDGTRTATTVEIEGDDS